MTTAECTDVDEALARAVVYRYLSEALRHPARFVLAPGEWRAPLLAALSECGADEFRPVLERCLELGSDRPRVELDYGRIIGHTPRAGVPPYESEWLGAAGDLLQYHQIADVSAAYKAFGLALSASCDERADHVGVELAFLQFLCAKEAWAGERGDATLARIARDGERAFLGEHVATWTPAFCRRIGLCASGGFYAALADFTAAWIDSECGRLGVPRGDPTRPPGESSITLQDTFM
jgi:TorA maturation chaperone TorD